MVFFLSCSKNSIPDRKLVAIATKRKKIKNLVQNYWSDLKIIWDKWSFADSRARLFILLKLMKKPGRHGGRTVFPIKVYENFKQVFLSKTVSEYDQEIPQSQTADKPVAS